MTYFFNTAVNIEGNKKLRTPQIEAYIKIRDYFSQPDNKEALVVLPTGTGKSGLISITPYGVSNKRVLIITPGLVTKDSIRKTQEVLEDNFWVNCDVIFNSKLSKIYGTVKDRDNKTLLKSIDAIAGILEEVKRMIR
ncbi:DEAD/DEAH box helicase family protein [Photorhabdus sp. APURE]|uniref:DEAD/DEAH box helicase family protein n=1 Tax=Photorhabdus aballayi TaxID=2991723 RepID=UPI00223C96A2|nr:DEAD/DEAH box helicase family protein [Photorhabdus aballayi]MCW7546772.1 DEAD/DEAH box helicase family protein [Photorhabdus aballayi]